MWIKYDPYNFSKTYIKPDINVNVIYCSWCYLHKAIPYVSLWYIHKRLVLLYFKKLISYIVCERFLYCNRLQWRLSFLRRYNSMKFAVFFIYISKTFAQNIVKVFSVTFNSWFYIEKKGFKATFSCSSFLYQLHIDI